MVHWQGTRRSARVIVVLAAAALVATSLAPVAGAAAGGKRPQGRWTLVNWEMSRAPADPQYVPGTASASQVVYSPRCRSGPCAVRVSPGGPNGTYTVPGEPAIKGTSRKAYRLAWNGKAAGYAAHIDYGRVPCTVGDGAGGTKKIPAGYTQTSDSKVTFRPARAHTTASITGQRMYTATGTPAGTPQGCTDFSVTAGTAGSPTGSVKVSAPGAAGQYRITEIVARTEGSGQRPRGFTGILVPDSTVTAKGRGLTITGIVGTATLRSTRAGWTGRVKATQASCLATSTEPGYETTETWTGLRPLARTGTGEPILGGTWRYVANPTASGVRDGCSLASNLGYVILVPMGAITP